jgi:hypothetical protein
MMAGMSNAILAGLVMALLTPASARAARMAPHDKTKNSDETRKVGALFAECVVKRKPREARAFVLYDPSSDWYKERDGIRLMAKVTDGDCLVAAANATGGIMMKFPNDTMKYVLADALFRAELENSPPLGDLKQVPPLEHPVFNASDFEPKPGKNAGSKQLAKLAENRDRQFSKMVFSQFGECVVRNDPRNSQRLLQTKVVTPEENAAFGALKGALSACVQENSTVTLNKMTVRGTVAYNYYRLAQHIRPAGAATSISEAKN